MVDIVLVHGLWNRGWSMAALARRLKNRGHNVTTFSYPTRSDSIDGHARELRGFIADIEAESLNFIGHSMGGLVILKLFSLFNNLLPGRIVLMGTPVQGSHVVQRLEAMPGHSLLFGKARENLLNGFDQCPPGYQTGMIRGVRPIGLGRVTGRPEELNDGTVLVSETELDGTADSIDLPVSHSEMLISSQVAAQAEQFLLWGHFKHPR